MSVNTTKAELVNRIKEWIQLESEMKIAQKHIRDLRVRKKEHTTRLVEIMKTNEIDCFDVKDGKLVYTKNKSRAPLGKKQLFASLEQYFKNDPTFAIADLGTFILDSRETRETESIRMK